MSSSEIEKSLELKQLQLDFYSNARPPWLPYGAQSIYGGTQIAHSLMAAQQTVLTKYAPSSMHCNFLIGGSPDTGIFYHVERISDDTSNVLRTVRAHQKDKLIFVALISFRLSRQDSNPSFETRKSAFTPPSTDAEGEITGGGLSEECPFVCTKVELLRSDDGVLENARTRQMIKTRNPIHSGIHCHIAALAYMSDNYLLPTTSRVHKILWTIDPELAKPGQIQAESKAPKGQVKMMVSLDHSVYFHDTTAFRADDWIMAEMETPWSGDGRALTLQKMYKQDGTLIATILQEGVFRIEPFESRL